MAIVAQACQNFTKRHEIQDKLDAKSAHQNTVFLEGGAAAAPIDQINFPVLLGGKMSPVGLQKNSDSCAVSPAARSPCGTPVDRSLSFRSNASSNASSSYSVKNTFVHVDDSSELESLTGLQRSASEPNLCKSQRSTPRHRAKTCYPSPSIASESQVSIGSVGHEIGTCKPCAWFWKAQGCENGSQCRHCHLCPQNEIKRRKYKKLADKKKQKQDAISQDVNENQNIISSSDVAIL